MQLCGLKSWNKLRIPILRIVLHPFHSPFHSLLPPNSSSSHNPPLPSYPTPPLLPTPSHISPTDSIFLTLHPRPTLFASFKYVGNAFDEDMARMARNEKVKEWWRMTDGMQESPVEGAVGSAEGPGWWGQSEEVFWVE